MATGKEEKTRPQIGDKKKARREKAQKPKAAKDVICSPGSFCVKVSDKGDLGKERVKVRYSGTGKRCPFFLSGDDLVAHCIGEFCMFWNDEQLECNINTIARSLAR